MAADLGGWREALQRPLRGADVYTEIPRGSLSHRKKEGKGVPGRRGRYQDSCRSRQ